MVERFFSLLFFFLFLKWSFMPYNLSTCIVQTGYTPEAEGLDMSVEDIYIRHNTPSPQIILGHINVSVESFLYCICIVQ
ncbi:hypothetical protein M6B38_138765 [Iris pallida]|uniref:Secreted protein n=1 Tax=Iris pallida TaxID=29817 RepID=A0AAX6DVR0_IRIPA|nr:hypothetical protein M6B38_223600 [Iris pallida]KAJ6814920.1 hypothetical protein M6B38_138765 [Iris pallida]